MSLRRDDSDRYTWFGFEKPFPGLVLLAWPFLWLWGTLRELFNPPVQPVKPPASPPTVDDGDGETTTFDVCLFPDGPGWTPIGTLPSGAPVYVREESYVWQLPDPPEIDWTAWFGALPLSPWFVVTEDESRLTSEEVPAVRSWSLPDFSYIETFAPEPERDFWGRTFLEHLSSNRFHTPENWSPRPVGQRFTDLVRSDQPLASHWGKYGGSE